MEFPPVKRTYSRRQSVLSPVSNNGNGKQPPANPKRQKKDILKGAASQPLNTLNRIMAPTNRKQYSGPTSIPNDLEDEGVILDERERGEEPQQPSPAKESGFRKPTANNKRFGINMGNLWGLRKDSKQKEHVNRSLVNASGDLAGSVRGAQENTNPSVSRVKKQPYQPKPYIAMATPLPTKTVLMTPLPAESKEAQLWSQNQKQSGFLRLPAEIRNAIYDLALGNKHIIVLHTPITVRPFRYCAQVYHKRPSQLRIGTTPTGRHSVGMTLLSGVCRQLYQETHLLAYKYNTWSFPSPLIMWNFLYHGRKLSREQLSMIEHLQVNEEPPSGALLQLLPGLKTVRLFDCWSEDYNQNGIYLVERQEKEVRLVLQFRQRY